jgi:hypothetical protein
MMRRGEVRRGQFGSFRDNSGNLGSHKTVVGLGGLELPTKRLLPRHE